MSTGDPLLVPAVDHEPDYWVADNTGMLSRRAMADASGPYERTITPTIAELSLQFPADLVADMEEAAAALSSFDQYARTRLGHDNPTLGPMNSILLRTESASSSQIENLTVSARQLALAQIDESMSGNANVVVANVRTMEAALRLADHLDSAALLEMHRVLLSGQRGDEPHAGRYREQLVWVGASAASPRGAAHIAPHHARVPAAIDDLVTFMARLDLPVVAQAAIAHAQFETIHPFTDGNGRTGRALVHALMRAKGLVTSTTPPISAGLLVDTDAYTSALTAYRRGDARPIVEQFAGASRFAAVSGSRLVDALVAQIDAGRAALDELGLRSQAGAWKVLPALIAQPVVNGRYLQDRLGMNPVAAQRSLDQLARAGVLVERTGMRRNRVWQHPGVVSVLDDFAAGLRRS